GLEPVRGNTEALYVVSHPLINANRIRISTLALGARMATICGFREYVEVGALMSYGPNLPALFRRAGEFVDKILRGTTAAELPVEQPTKWDLAINPDSCQGTRTRHSRVVPAARGRADRVGPLYTLRLLRLLTAACGTSETSRRDPGKSAYEGQSGRAAVIGSN